MGGSLPSPTPRPASSCRRRRSLVLSKRSAATGCEEISQDAGEAIYECSRCGGTQVEERRCGSCHVFMSKVSDESCETCEEPGPLTQISAFEADGQIFATREEAEDWVADAPNREAQKAKAKADLDDYMERRNAEAAARAEALRPRVEAALEIVTPETAPRMHSAISSTGESWGVDTRLDRCLGLHDDSDLSYQRQPSRLPRRGRS